MFKKRRRYLYKQILAADDRACQVRSFDNRLLYTNPKAASILGLQTDPFINFRNDKENQTLEELTDAYQNHLSFQTLIKKDQNIYDIRLIPIDKAILIIVNDKTATNQTYQVLETQLDVLSEMIRQMTVPIFLADHQENILYANPIFLQQSYLELPQIIGKNYISIFHTKNPNGWDIIPMKAGDENLILGIKKLKLAEQVSSDVDNLPVPAAIIDIQNWKILGINRAFSTTFDKDPVDLIGMDFMKLWNTESQKILHDIYPQLTLKKNNLTRDLTTLSSEYHFRAMWGYQDEHLVCFLFDITPRKKLELQLIQDQKMQALGQLTGGIAHDFNNILTAIIGFSDLLLQKYTPEDPSFSDIMQIKGNAQKAASLVGRLLTFSRKTPIQTKLISVHDALVDLTPLLQRSLAPISSLKLDAKKNLGCIRLDPNQLTQILLNLSVNAKDAMPKGGILKISVNREQVKKSRNFANTVLPSGDYIKIVASDNGEGIPTDILPHIFEPFFSTKEKSQESGTGLGLSTVYGIITSAGGFIGVDSEPNVGTTFTIFLPRFEEDKSALKIPQKSIPHIFLPNKNNKIVLADDEDGIRLVIKRALTVKGFDVIECQNATQAITAIQENSDVQLLITDMVMPGMDGEHLIQAAKALNNNIKAILMSGYSHEFERHTANAPLPFTFLTKPFALDELLSTIQKVLKD